MLRWFVLLPCLIAATACAAFETPESLLSEIYAQYGLSAASAGKACVSDAKGFDFTGKKAGNFIEPTLLKALKNDKELYGDPFIEGQDFCLKDLQIKALDSGADKAKIEVQFQNFDRKTKLIYEMIRTPKGWLIRDLIGTDGALRKSYKLK